MSRSCGGCSVTSTPPIETSPERDVLEPGDHAQQRRLAAAGRADEDAELSFGDLERERVDCLDAVRIDLRDLSSEIPLTRRSSAARRTTSRPSTVAGRPGSARRVRRVSSSQRASISSSVSVAARCRVEHRGVADVVGPALEHCAHGQIDDVRVGPVQRRQLRRVVGYRRRPDAGVGRRGTEPRRRCPPAAPGSGRCSGRCRRSRSARP